MTAIWPQHPSVAVNMARLGFGVDDIKVTTGLSYLRIAQVIERANDPVLLPWVALARKRGGQA